MRLIIHIGSPKTGTTSIQSNLVHNKRVLEDQGITYITPGGSAPSFNPLVVSISQQKTARVIRMMNVVKRDLNKGHHTAILSSELFFIMNPKRLARLFQRYFMDETLDVEIIVYLRRQDKYYESLFKQSSQRRGLTRNNQSYLDMCFRKGKLDYYEMLSSWQSAFESARIIPRIYDRALLPEGDIWTDFCEAIGLKSTLEDVVDEKNPSLQLNGDLYQLLIAHMASEDGNSAALVKALVESGKLPPSKSSDSFLLNDDRRQILERLRPGNEELRKLYFPEKESLFSPDEISESDAIATTFDANQLALLKHFFRALGKVHNAEST